MRTNFYIAFVIISVLTLFFWYLVAHSLYDISLDGQKDFVTDGCTLFPDSSWKKCCTEHDHAYWQGGMYNERQIADRVFRDCVSDSTDNKILSFVMYGAVRIGGTPFIAVPWRWGFGWSFGRGYR